MDKNTLVIEVNEAEMESIHLFRKKKQAMRASDERGWNRKIAGANGEKGAALAHSKKQGFKWCVTDGQTPARRR